MTLVLYNPELDEMGLREVHLYLGTFWAGMAEYMNISLDGWEVVGEL